MVEASEDFHNFEGDESLSGRRFGISLFFLLEFFEKFDWYNRIVMCQEDVRGLYARDERFWMMNDIIAKKCYASSYSFLRSQAHETA